MTTLPKILSIARAGSPARAWDLLVSEGWADKDDDLKALTLKGRLLKDQAKALQGVERVRLYGEAAVAYAAAAALENDSYPLINAASLALLGGKSKHAADLANKVLALLDSDPKQGENAYWRDATRAEALLLLGEETQARAALSDAMEKLPHAWEDHAATIGQFALIMAEQSKDAAWLDRHRPPVSLHFSGIIGIDPDDPKITKSIEQIIDQLRPGFAYGALAAGSDILIARAFCANETLQNIGAELHIVLPYPIDQFCDLSVRPYGDHWVALYDKLLSKAATVNILGLNDPPMQPAIELGNQVAMGMALRNARILQSDAKAVTIVGAGEKLRTQSQAWKDAGRELIVFDAQRQKSDARAEERVADMVLQQIKSFLWIEGTEEGPSQKVKSDASTAAKGADHWQVFDSPVKAYQFAMEIIAQQQSPVRIGLVCDAMDTGNPSGAVRMLAEELAAVAPAGSIATNQTGAMVATMTGGVESIEEIGELQSASGRMPLWALR